MLVAVTQDGAALRYASDALKDDKEIVSIACRTCGGALDDASDRLKADKELVLVAVKTQGAALSYVHKLTLMLPPVEYVLSTRAFPH